MLGTRSWGVGRTGMPLFWRVCLVNVAVFALGVAALAVSPATVSAPVLWREVLILGVGFVVIVIANALLLRRSLTPLDRLARLMEDVDYFRPGQRLTDPGGGGVGHLVRTFNAMLARLETERSASSAQALAAQEAERHRVAQELHDEIGQSLTVVLLRLKRAIDQAPPDIQAELLSVQDTARSALEEVRRIAQRLRPVVLEDLGLVNGLIALASEFTALTRIPVERQFAVGLPSLPPAKELVLYRVAQEGFTNIARHADASSVELSLDVRGDRIRLRLADDGTGIPADADGAGLQGIRDRTLLVGGQFRIGSRSGHGTELVVEVTKE